MSSVRGEHELAEVDLAHFLRAPRGTFVRGRSLAAFCSRQGLLGSVVVGRLQREDIQLILDTLRIAERLSSIDTLLDASRCTGLADDLFANWFGGASDYARRFQGKTRAGALVLPSDLETRSSFLGIVQMLEMPGEHHVRTSLPDALEALGVEQPTALVKALRALGDDLLRPAVEARHLSQRLSARELEVSRLAADGLSDLNIARALSIAESTVGAHLARAYRKLGVHSRVDLARALTKLDRRTRSAD